MLIVITHSMKGYTLVELVIVMAIMVVVGAGAVAGYVNFNDKQKVVAAAKTVQQAFRTAQAKARVKNTPTGCRDLQSYSVTVNPASVNIAANVTCDPGFSAPTETIALPYSDIAITSTQATIPFLTLERGTNLTAATVTISGDAVSYTFTVSPQGTISDIEKQP